MEKGAKLELRCGIITAYICWASSRCTHVIKSYNLSGVSVLTSFSCYVLVAPLSVDGIIFVVQIHDSCFSVFLQILVNKRVTK